jgi:hypothetical protein
MAKIIASCWIRGEMEADAAGLASLAFRVLPSCSGLVLDDLGVSSEET